MPSDYHSHLPFPCSLTLRFFVEPVTITFRGVQTFDNNVAFVALSGPGIDALQKVYQRIDAALQVFQ